MAFHMVMMGLLDRADLSFKAQDLRAIFAHGTVWWRNFAHLLSDPFGKGRQYLLMIVQIAGCYKLDIWVFNRHLISETINTVNQNAGKEEIREDHNTLVA